jgi:hypothetical protein
MPFGNKKNSHPVEVAVFFYLLGDLFYEYLFDSLYAVLFHRYEIDS